MKLLNVLLILTALIVASCNPKVAGPATTVGDIGGPVVNAFNVSVENKYYVQGQSINVVLTHPAVVTVAGGTPKLVLDIGGSAVDAPLASGSGTNQLTFSYTVVMNDLDTNGIDINPTLDLNGATIKYTEDAVEINANTSLTLPNLTGVKVDAITPTVSSVAVPASNTYYYNENLDFDVTFSETMVITGSPQMTLDIGGSIVQAQYQSGSGSNIIKFRKTVAITEIDLGGVSIASPLVLNSGTIKDVAGNNANLAFLPPDASGVVVNGVAPIVTSVAKPANGTYLLGQDLNFTVTFNKIVNVTNFPIIALDIGGSIVSLTYDSGSGTTDLIFKYTIQSGDQDNNGLDMNTEITLAGGTIKDASNNDARLTFPLVALGAVFVQAVEPTITSVTAPVNDMYETAEILEFTANFSEAVNITGTPRLVLTVGSDTVYANYHSGSGTSAIKFRYTVQLAHTDNDGIELVSPIDLDGGTIKSTYTIDAILTYTAPNTSGITVNDYAPSITSISAPANDTYVENDNLDFTVTWSENVTVTGTPRLTLDIGGVTRYATYQAGLSSSTVSIFRYTVVNPDTDNNGIGLTASVDLNSATIQDGDLNNASLTFTAPNLSGVLVESAPTTITSVTAPANGSYNEADQLDFLVNFSTNVDVTGSPNLTIDINGNSTQASYVSGNGTNSILFSKTVIASEQDLNGIGVTSPLQLNGGSIKDLAGNDANLAFLPPNTSGVLVDGVKTLPISITKPTDGFYMANDILTFQVHFNKIVTVTGTPTIALNIGGVNVSLNYQTGSGSNILSFTYTIENNRLDLDGIELATTITLNTGSILDTNLSAALLNLPIVSTNQVKVDSVAPYLSEVNTAETQRVYNVDDEIILNITFNESVTITNNPIIQVQIGDHIRDFLVSAGTGTTFTASYVVTVEDIDLDGVSILTPMQMNGAEIIDHVSNGIVDLNFNIPETYFIQISHSEIDLWLDADDRYYVFENEDCSSSAGHGANILCWMDKSIHRRRLTQSTPANAPLLLASPDFFNRGVMQFDGVSSHLMENAAIFPTVGIVFIVFLSHNAPGSADAMLWGEKSYDKAVKLSANNINTIIFNSSYPIPATPDQIAKVMMQNGNNEVNYVEETPKNFWRKSRPELARVEYQTITQMQNHFIGSFGGTNGFLNGEIAEIIVLKNNIVDVAVINYIDTYLKTKYQMP